MTSNAEAVHKLFRVPHNRSVSIGRVADLEVWMCEERAKLSRGSDVKHSAIDGWLGAPRRSAR